MNLVLCSRCNGSGHDGRCDICGGSGFVNKAAQESSLGRPLRLSSIQVFRLPPQQPSSAPALRTRTASPTERKSSSLTLKLDVEEERRKRLQEPKPAVKPMSKARGRGKCRLRLFPHPSRVKVPRPKLVSTGKWVRIPAADVVRGQSSGTSAPRLRMQRAQVTAAKPVTTEEGPKTSAVNIQNNPRDRPQREREGLPPRQRAREGAAAERTAFEIAFEKAQHNQDGSKHWGCYRDTNGQFGSFPAFDPCEDVDE